jgi:hypothetical protein
MVPDAEQSALTSGSLPGCIYAVIFIIDERVKVAQLSIYLH